MDEGSGSGGAPDQAVLVDIAAVVIGGAAAAGLFIGLAASGLGRVLYPLLLLAVILAGAAVVRGVRGTPKPFRFAVTAGLLSIAFVAASWAPWGGPVAVVPLVVMFGAAEARARWGSRRDWPVSPDAPPKRPPDE